MNIALDFDETITADPFLWQTFVGDAINRGHTVYIVTARRHDVQPEEVIQWAIANRCRVFFTSWAAKRPFMDSKGIHIHVWIDDNPENLLYSWNGKEYYEDDDES